MRHHVRIDDHECAIWLAHGHSADRLLIGDEWHTLAPPPSDAVVVMQGDVAYIHLNGRAHVVRYVHSTDHFADHNAQGAADIARAPMPGSVVSVSVAAGDTVSAGDAMAVIESMKMETVIRAARDGIVATVHIAPGGTFERDAPLVTLASEDA